MFQFEKLDAWRKAVDFAHAVYRLTARFPTEERFGLTSQMRRAAVSVSSNVAEEAAQSSAREFGHFIEIAYGSLMETLSQTHIAGRQGWVAPKERVAISAQAEELARMLSGLKASAMRKQSRVEKL